MKLKYVGIFSIGIVLLFAGVYVEKTINSTDKYLLAIDQAGGLTPNLNAKSRKAVLCDQLAIDSLDYTRGKLSRGNRFLFDVNFRANSLVLWTFKKKTCLQYDGSEDDVKIKTKHLVA